MVNEVVFFTVVVVSSHIDGHAPDKIEQTLAAARMLTPSGPVGQTHWSDSTANNPAPSAHSADAQLKVLQCLLLLSLCFFPTAALPPMF